MKKRKMNMTSTNMNTTCCLLCHNDNHHHHRHHRSRRIQRKMFFITLSSKSSIPTILTLTSKSIIFVLSYITITMTSATSTSLFTTDHHYRDPSHRDPSSHHDPYHHDSYNNFNSYSNSHHNPNNQQQQLIDRTTVMSYYNSNNNRNPSFSSSNSEQNHVLMKNQMMPSSSSFSSTFSTNNNNPQLLMNNNINQDISLTSTNQIGNSVKDISYLPLRKKQRRLVRDNPGVLEAIIRGLKMAIAECQYQFQDRRWDCPINDKYSKGTSIFGKILDKGCPETAFVYALTSAGVTHSIARSCAEGLIETCSCDYKTNRRMSNSLVSSDYEKDWEWGGCSDNIDFGVKFAKAFIDSAERGRDLRYLMNLHNNEAGRLHVQNEMRRECKCHGMSGSCTVKTCWMRLPTFRDIGNNIKDRFDGATRIVNPNQINFVSSNSANSGGQNARQSGVNGSGGGGRKKKSVALRPADPKHKMPTKNDLVYFEPSPDFCSFNPKLGLTGTHGRVCNETSKGIDGCELMCCGRGYKTEIREEFEACNCTFHWCCNVECKVCRVRKEIHTCL